MSLKNIYLLVGESGSGKTTIAEKLEKNNNLHMLRSYTTRSKRHESDDDHTYITEDEFDNLNGIVAFTIFNGFRYCATEQQINESDIYVVDPSGIDTLREHYKGTKGFIPIYIDVPMEIRLERMLSRGDSEDKAWERLKHDYAAFKNLTGVVPVNGISNDTWIEVLNIIKIVENEE